MDPPADSKHQPNDSPPDSKDTGQASINRITTPLSSGKKRKRIFEREGKANKKIFLDKLQEVIIDELLSPEKEREIISGSSTLFIINTSGNPHREKNTEKGTDEFELGTPLKTSTPQTQDDRKLNSIQKTQINSKQEHSACMSTNSKEIDIIKRIERITLTTNSADETITTQNRETTKITKAKTDVKLETNLIARACQSTIRKVESIKSQAFLLNFLTCVEIDHLNYISEITFWNSTFLHEKYLNLPRSDCPSATQYSHQYVILATYIRQRQGILRLDLEKISKQAKQRAIDRQTLITFTREQAEKHTHKIKHKVTYITMKIESTTKVISSFQNTTIYAQIDTFTQHWLKHIQAQLLLMKKEVRSNIYFGHKEKELGDISPAGFLKAHRQGPIVLENTLYWLERILHTNQMLHAESQFIITHACAVLERRQEEHINAT